MPEMEFQWSGGCSLHSNSRTQTFLSCCSAVPQETVIIRLKLNCSSFQLTVRGKIVQKTLPIIFSLGLQAARVISAHVSHERPQIHAAAKLLQSCPTLCNPMDCSLSGSSVYGIFQARVLEWLPFPSPGDLPDPGLKPRSPVLQADSLPAEPLGMPVYR